MKAILCLKATDPQENVQKMSLFTHILTRTKACHPDFFLNLQRELIAQWWLHRREDTEEIKEYHTVVKEVFSSLFINFSFLAFIYIFCRLGRSNEKRWSSTRTVL